MRTAAAASGVRGVVDARGTRSRGTSTRRRESGRRVGGGRGRRGTSSMMTTMMTAKQTSRCQRASSSSFASSSASSRSRWCRLPSASTARGNRNRNRSATRASVGEGEGGEAGGGAGGTPTAVALTRSVIDRTVRDAPLCLALTVVAGIWAQALNLGGTFALALFQLHVVPVVAALFSLSVALWKFSCAYFVRTSVLRAAEDGAGVDAFDYKANLSRASPRRAWASLKESRDKFKALLALDARRVLSIAWNSLITVPIPYLGLIRLLDFAVAGPVLVLENKTSAEAMKRSQELMYGYRVLLMKTAFLCSTVAAALLVGVIGLFMLAVPTLPSVLLPPVTPGVPTTVGEVASGFISGSAFDRVWVVGSPLERTATIALLICGLVLSFLFTLGFRELVHLFYTETKARYVPQPPPDPTEKKPLFSRLRFWKKDKP